MVKKTSKYKIQMTGNYPEESIQHSEHGKSLKSRGLELFLIDLLLRVYLRTLIKFPTFYVTERFITVFTRIHPVYSSL